MLFRFDLAGNLGAKITGKLAASNQEIKYEYDHGRLKQITYPNMAAVSYEYGTSEEAGNTKGNLVGRVKKVTMEGGSESRYYDRLGNVSTIVTTLIHPKETNLAPQVFSMSFNYDSFGRMLDMTFPNWVKNDWTIMTGYGEKITYSYDCGGLLKQITGHHQTPNPEQTSHPVSVSTMFDGHFRRISDGRPPAQLRAGSTMACFSLPNGRAMRSSHEASHDGQRTERQTRPRAAVRAGGPPLVLTIFDGFVSNFSKSEAKRHVHQSS